MSGDDEASDRRPEAWSAVRRRLAAQGFHPSRRLGQNFLVDDNMVLAIARDAELPPGARVLEVGVGLGVLTDALLALGAEVVAVEIDGRLAELARERFAGELRLTLLHADALDGKHRLAEEVDRALGEQPWQLVANLPYSIAAPLLVVLARRAVPPDTMTVLVQKEVAERLAARPGTPEWGPLSVRLQLDYTVRRLRDVGPTLFWPRPKVESSVVRLARRPDPGPDAERVELDALVHALFTRRRQALGRVLAERTGDRPAVVATLAELGRAPELRAEVLDEAELARLARTPLWRGRPREGGGAGRSARGRRRGPDPDPDPGPDLPGDAE
jgi:16S rRNA (adenine1518-N6/adenine1519-N6)-dimethyltransferase